MYVLSSSVCTMITVDMDTQYAVPIGYYYNNIFCYLIRSAMTIDTRQLGIDR